MQSSTIATYSTCNIFLHRRLSNQKSLRQRPALRALTNVARANRKVPTRVVTASATAGAAAVAAGIPKTYG